MIINGKSYSGIVSRIQLILTIEKENFVMDTTTGLFSTTFSQRILKCEEKQGFCVTETITFIWETKNSQK